MLNAALEYLQRGWSVIPLKRDKKTYLNKWEPFQERLATREQVQAWWTNWPDANIGIVTGKLSGVVVIDADGPEGVASLRTLGAIPPTPAVQTSRGWHYYFAHPGSEVKTRAKILPDLDVRGDGGYAVAPPSTHSSGWEYEWAILPEDVAPAKLPPGMLALLSKDGTRAPVGEKSVDWVNIALAGVKDGARNATAAKLAGHFLGKGLPPSEAEQLLLAWNRNNKPPLSDQEIATVVASVARSDAEKKQGDRNFEIAKIQKITTEPPLYLIHVFERVVKMNSEDLASFSRFKRLVMQVTDIMPTIKKLSDWDRYLNESLASHMEIIEAPEEASQEAVWWEAVVNYLRTREATDEAVLVEQRGVYRDDLYYYMHGPSLYKHLQQRQYRVEPRDLWDLLRKRGAEHGPKRVKTEEGSKVLKIWWVPIETVMQGQKSAADDTAVDISSQKEQESEIEPY